jgi:hypothetical protein
MKNHLTTAFYSLAEQHPEFIKGVQYAARSWCWTTMAGSDTVSRTEDPWLAKRGHRVLELPTGQGLFVK